MYKKLSQIKSWKYESEREAFAVLALVAGGHTGVSRAQKLARSSAKVRSWQALWRFVQTVFYAVAAVWAWAFSARLVRSIGPGKQALERHEFESVELRQGGFGGRF